MVYVIESEEARARATAECPTSRYGVERDLVARVLEPYRANCKYLLEAEIEHPSSGRAWSRAHGVFSVPEPCYIAATGHFNAVDFNICYNQLAYVLVAESVRRNLLATFEPMTLDEYFARQLPDFLIVSLESRFSRPMLSERFAGTVTFEEPVEKRACTLIQTHVEFSDDAGPSSRGSVLLAVMGWPARPTTADPLA